MTPETDRALAVMLDLDVKSRPADYTDNAYNIVHGEENGGVRKVCVAIDEMVNDAKEEGREKEVRDSLFDFLNDIGIVPEAVRSRINQEKDRTVLRQWMKLAAKAESMEEFADGMGQVKKLPE